MLNMNVLLYSALYLEEVLDQMKAKDDLIKQLWEEEESFNLFGLFQVNFDNYIKIKFAFMHHMRIQPDQIEMLPYYEYEEYVELLTDVLKKKQEANKEAPASSSINPSSEAQKFMRGVKMPSTPKLK